MWNKLDFVLLHKGNNFIVIFHKWSSVISERNSLRDLVGGRGRKERNQNVFIFMQFSDKNDYHPLGVGAPSEESCIRH